MWDAVPVVQAERTRRLLKICQDLQARKEGLLLLDLLGRDVYKSPKDETDSSVFYEGVGNSAIARCIVELVLNTGGWYIIQCFQASI